MSIVIDPNKYLGSQNVRYSDLQFQLKTTTDGNVSIVKNTDSVTQSIKAILSTSFGERWMLPEFGSRVRDLLFGQMDIGTVDLLEAEIENALERWEPRIIVTNIGVEALYDKNAYVLTIEYQIISFGVVETFVGTVKGL